MKSSILINSCKKIINKIFIFVMVASTYNVIKTIEIFCPPKQLRKEVASIICKFMKLSQTYAICNVFQIRSKFQLKLIIAISYFERNVILDGQLLMNLSTFLGAHNLGLSGCEVIDLKGLFGGWSTSTNCTHVELSNLCNIWLHIV